MANPTLTPCTTFPVTAWSFLAIQRIDNVQNEAIVPSYIISATQQTNEYLGDAEGKPQRLISQPGANQVGVQADFMTQFGEVITRADGSKMTALQLVDAILTGLVNTPAAVVAPVAPIAVPAS